MTDWLTPYQERVNQQLQLSLGQYQNNTTIPLRLGIAMRYGVFNGGKRIRPALAYMTAKALGGDLGRVDQTACAIEMIHTYSLIHDDLPAMDDDDLRRGKPTLHIQYDEATAILAGDALQTLAFELLANDALLDTDTRIRLIDLIARKAGPAGMVAGQMMDLLAANEPIVEEVLVTMQRRKTGDLISASVLAGVIIAGANEQISASLRQFSYHLGLAFQVKDDILDYTGETETMGKPQGSDVASNKTTFITVLGLDAARVYLDNLYHKSLAALSPLGESAALLRKLTAFVSSRDH